MSVVSDLKIMDRINFHLFAFRFCHFDKLPSRQ
jgi:hypothetical protein